MGGPSSALPSCSAFVLLRFRPTIAGSAGSLAPPDRANLDRAVQRTRRAGEAMIGGVALLASQVELHDEVVEVHRSDAVAAPEHVSQTF